MSNPSPAPNSNFNTKLDDNGSSSAKFMSRKLMETYDKEKKGYLSEAEIMNILIDIYRNYNKTYTPTKSDIEGFMQLLDQDFDNMVCRQDIENSYKKFMIPDTATFSYSCISENARKKSYITNRSYMVNTETPSNYQSDDCKTDERTLNETPCLSNNHRINKILYLKREFSEECDFGIYMSENKWQIFMDKYGDQIGFTNQELDEIFKIASDACGNQNMADYETIREVIESKITHEMD